MFAKGRAYIFGPNALKSAPLNSALRIPRPQSRPHNAHKILLDACVVVVAVFLLFALCNDYPQTASSRDARPDLSLNARRDAG
ncbi:hypothetical protein AABC73_19765 [Pseudomonas sp. G.S.17]|uniref:hypothetical protein n=1 Tax=Pseudomonas sp. G.S.17 TaxID=3137451 RepID=UPI00311CAA37